MAERCSVQPEYDAAKQLYYDGKYAQAAWAFEALGDYEDAEKQKAQAELSWRRSLATVAIDNTVGENRYGAYYVNSNGTVDHFPNTSGTAHKNTGINVVSISTGNQLFSLLETGVLENVSQNGMIDETQWQDIIQTTPFFVDTNAV